MTTAMIKKEEMLTMEIMKLKDKIKEYELQPTVSMKEVEYVSVEENNLDTVLGFIKELEQYDKNLKVETLTMFADDYVPMSQVRIGKLGAIELDCQMGYRDTSVGAIIERIKEMPNYKHRDIYVTNHYRGSARISHVAKHYDKLYIWLNLNRQV